MNGAQSLLVLGAIVLFSIVTLNAHRTVLNASKMTISAETTITAAEIGETLITEIKSKEFDENVIGTEITDVNNFSAPPLGPAGDETLATYDDVDDYHNYSRVITAPRLGSFTATVAVDYVQENSPEIISSTKTHMKRIRVTVTNPLLQNPVILNYYACY